MKNSIASHLILKISLVFLLSSTINGCTNGNNTTTNNNQEVISKQEPISKVERVVALTSLSADIIHQLDASKLVGVAGSTLLKQDSRFQGITTVSEGRSQPDLEKIIELKPDLVVGADGFNDQTLAKLNELGVKTISTKVDSWFALQDTIKILAKAIEADPQPLLKSYQTLLPKNIQSNISTLVLVSRQPILAPNKNSWTGDLLTQFKVNNVVADLQGSGEFSGYVTLSPEKILETNPEIIIIVDPAKEGILEQLKKESFWSKLNAVKGDRVYTFDYYGLVNPGSMAKVKDTLTQLAQVTQNN
jgi:iron complex transport system substrate-binding protein